MVIKHQHKQGKFDPIREFGWWLCVVAIALLMGSQVYTPWHLLTHEHIGYYGPTVSHDHEHSHSHNHGDGHHHHGPTEEGDGDPGHAPHSAADHELASHTSLEGSEAPLIAEVFASETLQIAANEHTPKLQRDAPSARGPPTT